jgi:NadR type nicotinamide-nucleotide adenylyltransferase
MDRGAPPGLVMKARGFVLGKFMPPHAGHVSLIDAARMLVRQLTILVCWLPDDPIPGPLRLEWMRQLFPECRVLGHGEVVPQTPDDSSNFWRIWQRIVRDAHPEPIDYVFAGEGYGAELAREVGGFHVPLGGRVLQQSDRIGELSASAVRGNPAAYWDLLPWPVRSYYRRTVCLHGGESTGKSTLSASLAAHFNTIWVPEYGRSHCQANPGELSAADLRLIGQAQTAMIKSAEPWAGDVLITDTDALMTAAWSRMLLGEAPRELLLQPKADLYLLLEPDLPWADDGTRFFRLQKERVRFAALAEDVLVEAGVTVAKVRGEGPERQQAALAAISSHLSTSVAQRPT